MERCAIPPKRGCGACEGTTIGNRTLNSGWYRKRGQYRPSVSACYTKIRMKRDFDTVQHAWERFYACLEKLASQPSTRRICELGAGANPALSLSFIERNNLEYTILDISTEELAKAPSEYVKVRADITSPDLPVSTEYDLVFSKMLAEHVRDPRIFHKNVRRLLSADGIAYHFFPTLYAPPFVLNRLLPEPLSEFILLVAQPGRQREGKYAKFPTYYGWCRGPSPSQIRRLESSGYTVEEYVGFFGHEYYRKIKPLHKAQRRISSALVRYPLPWLTSYAYVVMRRKGA